MPGVTGIDLRRSCTRRATCSASSPSEEADRLDELAIVDDDMAWRVRTVENDLVDAHVRGTLDAESRHHFQTALPRIAETARASAFAARLARAVDALGSPEDRPNGSGASRRRRRRATNGPARAGGQRAGQRAEKSGWLDWLVPRSAGGWRVAYRRRGTAAGPSRAAFSMMRDPRLGRALNESEQQRAALDRRARIWKHQLAEQRAAEAEDAGALDQRRRRRGLECAVVAAVVACATLVLAGGRSIADSRRRR